MSKKPQVLLVEDSLSLAAVYTEYLKSEPISLCHAENGARAKELIEELLPQVVLLDLKLPDIPGQEILSWMQKKAFPCETIVITAHGSVDIAVDMMRLGAKDFLQKPFDANRLVVTLRNAQEHYRLQNIVERFSETFERKKYHNFVGSSLPMQAVYQTIDSAAPSKATIFITGESGTGKEVCAEAIHKQSRCKNGPFIPLNCGAIPKDLMESEIFGHVKGAFTGAQNERKGAASQAHGGTLFLDEIGEMDMELQTKLLRFIQSGTIKKVGGSKEETVDVRFVCATNRDPLEEVKSGRFREDLYYRLNVVPLHLPALRERDDDIILLAQHFLTLYAEEDGKSFKRYSSEVEGVFRQYSWPGNVRQLQNIVRNIVVLNNDESVKMSHLPPPLDKNTQQLSARAVQETPETVLNDAPQSTTSDIRPLAHVERETIEAAIKYCDGNIPKAAALLEVSPSTIYRKKQGWEN